MNLFNLHSIYILIFLASSVLVVAQDSVIPLYTYPPNDGTKSYFVKGGNGTNIFVDEKGDPKKNTILFSSGHLTSRISWDPQWFDPELYKKFHLVRYDYRGIGRSGKPNYPNSHSLDLFSDDLSAVINELHSNYNFKKKKIILIGWSIGTPVSINFMKRYPNVVIDGLISVCGIVNNSNIIDDTVAPYLPDIIDPKENFPKVVLGLDVFVSHISFKPFSDELRSFFLGNAVVTPLEYRRAVLGKYRISS